MTIYWWTSETLFSHSLACVAPVVLSKFEERRKITAAIQYNTMANVDVHDDGDDDNDDEAVDTNECLIFRPFVNATIMNSALTQSHSASAERSDWISVENKSWTRKPNEKMMKKKRFELNKGRIRRDTWNYQWTRMHWFDQEKKTHWKKSASFCVMPSIGMHSILNTWEMWREIFNITADVQCVHARVFVCAFIKTYHASCEPSIERRVLPSYVHSNRSEHHRFMLRVNQMLLLLFFYSFFFFSK